VNVAKYQRGVCYLGVKVFNAFPSDIKIEFNNPKKFKVVLQKFLYEKFFYSLDEYFDLQKCKIYIWIHTFQSVLQFVYILPEEGFNCNL